jgi:hypothetical protein
MKDKTNEKVKSKGRNRGKRRKLEEIVKKKIKGEGEKT